MNGSHYVLMAVVFVVAYFIGAKYPTIANQLL